MICCKFYGMVLFLISGNWRGLWILEQLVATPLDFGNSENISNLRWQIKFLKLIIDFNKLKLILPFIALISFVKISRQFPQFMAISWYTFLQKNDASLRYGISFMVIRKLFYLRIGLDDPSIGIHVNIAHNN